MSDPVESRLLKARVQLLMQQSFIGQVLMHLDFVEAEGTWCRTASTDGKRIYYNRAFIEALRFPELMFLIGHETLHVVLDHVARRGDRDPEYWNMAVDYICNFILKKSDVGEMPKGGLYDQQYTDDFSSEELYTLLLKQKAPVKQPLDVHMEEGGTEADGTVRSGQPKPLTAQERKVVREEMQGVILQAAGGAKPGSLSAGIERMLNRLRQPKISWRQSLFSNVRSVVRADYAYSRLSRRSHINGLVLPGRRTHNRVKVAAWLDGSASTSEAMITDFLSECGGILSSFRDFELTIGTFDTEVYNVKVFTPENRRDIHHYQFKGGGGTAPSCCWDYMKAHKMQPDKVLLFTDGAVGADWGDPTFADTLFIVHSNPWITAPYGRTVHYEN